MKNTQYHTRKKDNDIEDDVYVNVEELAKEGTLMEYVGKNIAPTTKNVSTSKTTKTRSILAALILLIILFLISMVITSVLLKYYLAISKQMSHLKNYDDRQQMVLEDVKTFKKDLDNVQQHVLQDIKAINKTLKTSYRTCPSGWKPIGLFCYYFSSDELPWDNATNECIRKGSALMSIKSKEELDVLKSFLKGSRYWIALRRDKEPGKWKWLDGSMMTFSNWKQGQPDNYKNREDCGESSKGYWNDENCNSTLKYACKKGCCC